MYVKKIKGTGTKKILIIAGIHGNESNAVNLLSKISRKYEINTTNIGQVTFLNAINTTGLKYNTREFQEEESKESNDLNRYFDTETKEDKIQIMEELSQYIKEHDLIIDIHNSPNVVIPSVVIALNEHAPFYIRKCDELNIPYILYSNTNTIKKYADLTLGKEAYTIEVNQMGYNILNDFEVDCPYDQSSNYNALKAIIDKLTKSTTFNKKEYEDFSHLEPYKCISLTSYHEGLYEWNTDCFGKLVKEGTELASIVDPIDRKKISSIRAPRCGRIMTIFPSYWASVGSCAGDFQPVINIS